MPFDTMIDLAINDDLNTSFMPDAVGGGAASWPARGRAWLDPRVVVGASDAGAHLDMIDTFAYSSKLLQYGVREFGVITLEEAVRQLTDVPARLVGLVGRGRIEVGYHADFAIFDADEVGAGPIHSRFDLPAGALRLYCEAQGVCHVIVSGTPIIKDGERTGYRTGNILRSGIDTETPSLELTA
jgi:N-acyl-D-aspartate/D-glutamate deacylase